MELCCNPNDGYSNAVENGGRGLKRDDDRLFGFAGVKVDTEGSDGESGGPFLVSASTLPFPLTLAALPLDE